jgi:hypothetical protein
LKVFARVSLNEKKRSARITAGDNGWTSSFSFVLNRLTKARFFDLNEGFSISNDTFGL